MNDTDKPATERTVEQFCADQMARRITRIADRMREFADRVERGAHGVSYVAKREQGWNTYASIASEVQHEIVTMLANLHAEGLTTDAQQADEYRLKGE